MSKRTEAYFVEHCDEPGCDLGAFHYECPCCGNKDRDFDVWWERDEVYGGKDFEFDCSKCEKKLVVSWDKEKWGIFVKEVK